MYACTHKTHTHIYSDKIKLQVVKVKAEVNASGGTDDE